MQQGLLILLLMCVGAVVYGVCRIAMIIARSYRRESRFLGEGELQVLLATYQYGKAADNGEGKQPEPDVHPPGRLKKQIRSRPPRKPSRRNAAAVLTRHDRSKRSRETRRLRPEANRRTARPRSVRKGASARGPRRRR